LSYGIVTRLCSKHLHLLYLTASVAVVPIQADLVNGFSPVRQALVHTFMLVYGGHIGGISPVIRDLV
jgi:hypothetical protein